VQFLQTAYTVDFRDKHSSYHADVIRSKLIRIVPTIFQDIHDELVLALNDIIPTVSEGMSQVRREAFASS
jgi:hypoxanthine-guanine phosphoribosyltransferase